MDGAAALDRMHPLTADQLRAIMPDAGAAANLYVGPLNNAMAAHGIATAARRRFVRLATLKSRGRHTAPGAALRGLGVGYTDLSIQFADFAPLRLRP